MRGSARLRPSVTTLAIAAGMAVPALQPRLAASLGPSASYDWSAVLLVLAMTVAVIAWPSPTPPRPVSRTVELVWMAAAGVVVLALLYATAIALLPVVFAGPPDVFRGDMLVITEAGVRRVLAGHTPYTMYRVPWEMTLSYGPGLWGPFVLPVVLHADVRCATLVALGTLGAGLTLSAARGASQRHWLAAATVVGLGTAVLVHPSVRGFFPIGHTLIYWPLLLAFCALLAVDRWLAAAAALGLLVAARTTMAALVPVYLIAAHRERRLDWRLVATLAAAAIGPFVPFMLAGPRSVEFAMYGAYQKTIKGFVWTNTHWAHDTIGVTGALLRHGWQRYTEAVQAVALGLVYLLSWIDIRRGQRPEPWMAMALLVFSMTTLWPVSYLYYDVWVLVIAAYAFRMTPPPARLTSLAGAAAVSIGLAIVATLAAGSVLRGTLDIDVGTPAAAPMTGGGFGEDRAVMDGTRSFVWVEGTTARVRAPRAAFSDAVITVDLKPFGEDVTPRQQLRMAVNGHVVGDPVALQPGWQTVTVTAPRARWNYGFNILTLEFSRTAVEPETGRRLSAGIDRIGIR